MTIEGLAQQGPAPVIALPRRVFAVLALAFTAAYLLPAWMTLDGLPWPVRAGWPVVAVFAAMWPSASWLAFVAGAPLLPILPALQAWPGVSLVAMWLFALLVPAWARLAWKPGGGALGHWPALFLLLVSASLVATLAPFAAGGDGLRGLMSRLHEFLRDDFVVLEGQRHLFASVLAWAIVAEGVGMGWLAARFLRDRGPSGPRDMAVAAVTGAALVSAWGVRQWWTRDHLLPFWREVDPFIVRVNASFTDVNALGSYLAALTVVALALAASAREATRRLVCGVAAVTMAAALLFTASRTAWAALVFGVAVYAWLAWRAGAWGVVAGRHAAKARRALVAGALGLALVLAALTAYATAIDARHLQQRSYFDTVLHTLNLRVSPADKLKGRLPLWAAAWRMVEAQPLSGIGIGRFYKDVSLFAPEDAVLIRPQENAHNYFLQLASECGVPTLIAWVVMIAAAASASWRAARAAPPAVRHLVCGAIGGLSAFLLTCVTGHPLLLREGQYAFWVLLAMAGAGTVAVQRDRAGHRGRLLAVAAGLAVLAWLPWRVGAEMAAVDLSRVPAGVHAVEVAPDGSFFRWTRERATFYVPADSHRVELWLRTLAPAPQQVDVLLDGERVDRLRLDDHAWRQLRYVLPAGAHRRRFVELVIAVEPTWRAQGDARDLGVMVRDLRWSR